MPDPGLGRRKDGALAAFGRTRGPPARGAMLSPFCVAELVLDSTPRGHSGWQVSAGGSSSGAWGGKRSARRQPAWGVPWGLE